MKEKKIKINQSGILLKFWIKLANWKKNEQKKNVFVPKTLGLSIGRGEISLQAPHRAQARTLLSGLL